SLTPVQSNEVSASAPRLDIARPTHLNRSTTSSSGRLGALVRGAVSKSCRCPTGEGVDEQHAFSGCCRGNPLQNFHVVSQLIAIKARVAQLYDRCLYTIRMKYGHSCVGRVGSKAIRSLVRRPFGDKRGHGHIAHLTSRTIREEQCMIGYAVKRHNTVLVIDLF